MLGLDLFPGIASFAEASSSNARSGPLVSLSSNLGLVGIIS